MEPRPVSRPACDLDSLGAAPLLLAQVYACVVPHYLPTGRVQAVLAAAGIPPLDGQRGTDEIDRLADDLIDAGLAERGTPFGVQRDPGVALIPTHALPLLQSAIDRHRQGPIIDALLATRPEYAHEHVEYDAALRGALLTGDAARYAAIRADYPGAAVDWDFLAQPFVAEAIARVPAADLPDVLDACLAQMIRHTLPADPIIDACAASPAPARHAERIAYARVLQGRLGEAAATYERLPLEDRRAKPIRAALAATQALVAMLRGDDQSAMLAIEEALGIESGAGKRLTVPRSRAFALSLLALVRSDLPECRDLLAKIDAAPRGDYRFQPPPERDLVRSALAIKRRSGAGGDRPPPDDSLNVLFDALVSAWAGRLAADEARRQRLRAYAERAAGSGFEWVAAECSDLLRCAEAGPQESNGQPVRRTEAGTVALATLEAPPPTLAQSLAMVDRLADALGEAAADVGEAATRRLAWELDCGGSLVELEAREQQRKGASWSKGRQMGIKRLSALAAKEDYLLPQDRAAIAAAETAVRFYRKEEYFGARSLHALAGHPHVADRAGRAVEVVRREPALSVGEDADGGVTMRLEPYPAGTDGEYAVRMVGEGRCEVTHFTPAHLRLLAAIPAAGLAVPADERARVLSAVSSLSAAVRVQSAAGGAKGAAEVAADPLPWICLEPFERGLSVALAVEPIAESGMLFEAGIGGAVVFASREGERVQAHRDLAAERQAVDDLVAACPWLASRPSALNPLNVADAEHCLDLLEQLEAAGARCKWPKGEHLRIVGRATPAAFRLKLRSAAQWMQASGELQVDDERVLDLKELFGRLEANPGSRFLDLGDGQFLALGEAFRRRLEDFAGLAAPGAKGAVRLSPLAIPALDELLEEATLDADAESIQRRDELHRAATAEPPLPTTLQAELRPYQYEGFRWLARLARWGAGACLADDMGLGKTLQTLAVLLERAPDGPALVVAPTSVVPNWLAEARRFAPTLNARPYAGAAAARAAMLADAGPFDVFVATYGVLQNDADSLAEVHWHSAVLDEAQAIKNPNAKRTAAARQLQASFKVVTTGTPVQNNLMDLYSVFSFVNPRLFGSLRHFRDRFLVPIERYGSEAAQGRLRRLIAPFVLRRLKTDVLDDLPERTEITLHVKMSPEEAALYEALRQRAVEDLAGADGPSGRMRLFAHLTRLRLACCNPRLVRDAADAPPSSKLATFAATLDDLLANKHKVLVFSQFVMHLKLVEEHLRDAGVRYQYLDGATPSKDRTERINAFQAGDGDVFLISLKAGGTGLNLTAADYVIHMDPWWNPAVEDQASDRAHRIGQTRPVTIYRLVAEGTIEEQIVDLHRRKRDLADQLLEGTDAPGTLDAEELLALLRAPLREDAT